MTDILLPAQIAAVSAAAQEAEAEAICSDSAVRDACRKNAAALAAAAETLKALRPDVSWIGWAVDHPEREFHVEFCGTEADAWRHALGWPSEQEIEAAKKRGARAFEVWILEAKKFGK